jgi:hypothetical protein
MTKYHSVIESALQAHLKNDIIWDLAELPAEDAALLIGFLDEHAAALARMEVN